MERKLASIQRVLALEAIPNAKAISDRFLLKEGD